MCPSSFDFLWPSLFAPETGVFPDWVEYPFVVVVTTTIWLAATYMTQPESPEVLRSFYKKIQPGGPGWAKVVNEAKADGEKIAKDEKWSVPQGITAMLLGCVLIYTIMFATGYWIYGRTTPALVLTGVAIVSAFLLIKAWNRMKEDVL